MAKASAPTNLLMPLGILLALVLAALAGLMWLGSGTGAAGAGDVGRLVALVQASRSEARDALSGDRDSLALLDDRRGRLERVRRGVAADETVPAASRFAADGQDWQTLAASFETIIAAESAIADFHTARLAVLDFAPELLAAMANMASVLPPEQLQANRIYLDRFELTVQGMQQDARSLAAPGADAGAVQRLGDGEQFLAQLIRGLRGEDSALGITALNDTGAVAGFDEMSGLFDEARAAIGDLTAAAPDVDAAAAAAVALNEAGASLMRRFQELDLSVTAGPAIVDDTILGDTVVGELLLQNLALSKQIPLALAGASIVILLLMLMAYRRAMSFHRAADVQARQNDRNQHAILRLLDELSSLADGDLTVQATVSEDITGAIADSINYAIDALRELVATINDSSILIDAAAKQSEVTARHLVRSSETQSKQAAAASEAVKQMVVSVEGVSGNAERCSDVARHAVEVAHKGGAAVRRTIEGMNTIRETIQDTSKRIKRLGESSQEIGNIVGLIEEIAEQTNILALNASIEASRAGEASRGFAVVADEVQRLAERSTDATREIEALVRTIQSDTNEAVVSMERSTTDVVGGALLAENAGAALDEIEQVSHQIASLVQNISGAAREQNGVSESMNKNMSVLREISSMTRESTAATSSGISKLSELASQLRQTVSGFSLPDRAGRPGVLDHSGPLKLRAPVDDTEVNLQLPETPERQRQSG